MSATIAAEPLRRFVQEVFAAQGLPDKDAAVIAEVLLWANLRGIDSHGVVRVPQYVRHVHAGEMNPRPAMLARSDAPGTVLIDADRAAGPVAMSAAADAAIGKARAAGIGLALVRSTTHTAALGYYTSRAAREGLAAIAMTGGVPQMAYHGARGPAVSTSPFSIAVPGGARGPVVFDMATSVVGLGKLLQTGKAGQAIPAGWATDADGNPTTDPARATVPLPIAGPKGSGLSLMIELLTGIMASNPVLAHALETSDFTHRQNGLVIAIDVARFGSVDAFRREAVRLAKALKALRPSDPGVEIRIPGERGDRVFEQRSRDGIPLPPPVLKELSALAAQLGLRFPS